MSIDVRDYVRNCFFVIDSDRLKRMVYSKKIQKLFGLARTVQF